MYTRFQVILIAEDGERVLSEWQTSEAAYKEARKLSPSYGEGQWLEVRAFTGAF